MKLLTVSGRVLPRADSFLVLIIFAANSRPVCLWTHRFTTENAPLKCQSHVRALLDISHLLAQLLLKLIIVGKLGTRLLRHLGDRQAVGVESVQHATELRWQGNGRQKIVKLAGNFYLSHYLAPIPNLDRKVIWMKFLSFEANRIF